MILRGTSRPFFFTQYCQKRQKSWREKPTGDFIWGKNNTPERVPYTLFALDLAHGFRLATTRIRPDPFVRRFVLSSKSSCDAAFIYFNKYHNRYKTRHSFLLFITVFLQSSFLLTLLPLLAHFPSTPPLPTLPVILLFLSIPQSLSTYVVPPIILSLSFFSLLLPSFYSVSFSYPSISCINKFLRISLSLFLYTFLLLLQIFLFPLASILVCPSAWNNSATNGRIFMKFGIWIFFETLSR